MNFFPNLGFFFFPTRGRGFTIMELLLAMGIFMLSIIFVSNVFRSSNQTIGDAKDEAIAFELVVEGVEWFGNMPYGKLAKALNDSTYLSNLSKKFGTSINSGFKGIAPFEADGGVIHQYFDSNLVGQSKWNSDYFSGRFEREIKIIQADADVIEIRSRIRYYDKSKPRIIELPMLVVNNLIW